MRPSPRGMGISPWCAVVLFLFHCGLTSGCLSAFAGESVPAAETPTNASATNGADGMASRANSCFNVETYVVAGSPSLSTNVVIPILSKYTGAKVNMQELVKAATELQLEYRREGHPMTSVAIATNQIVNGVVTLNVFQSPLPQIVISGVRVATLTNNLDIAEAQFPPEYVPPPPASNAPPVPAEVHKAVTPATPEEMAQMRAALFQKMAELAAEKKDTRIHVVSTNAGPRFDVAKYLVRGNSVLPPVAINAAITNIDGAFGTNVSFDGIQTVVTELGKAYYERGYEMVKVAVPQQKLTNATVKLQVLEGRLADIQVVSNRFFSSNNVMRALPSLHPNMVLNVPIFNAELNRANVNQDRQIYPLIKPGPMPGTSDLALNVEDRLPLHAKLELNNQASPGTPALRLNSSAVYDNLWQLEHSLGVQYSFSPELYKQGGPWELYDEPMVVNYSAFYRMPLGEPESIENAIAANPGNFGYDEATRKFNLPPASGRPDLTFFASRSTIDAGLATTLSKSLTAPGSNPSISRQDVEDSPTKNEDLGAHLNLPLPPSGNFESAFSGGLNFKTYGLTSYKTNNFLITETNFDQNGLPIFPPVRSVVPSAVPLTTSRMEYLPLSLRYDGNWHDSLGTMSFGLGVNANVWYDSLYATTSTDTNGVAHTFSRHGTAAITNITGSAQSSGHWVVLNPSFSRDITIDNWTTLMRADGQWASEPLISPEQFGAGGVNSVRGYHEGEVFGDSGWHFSLEETTPEHVVGTVYGGTPLTIQGSVYMDCATVYSIDPPPGSRNSTRLWGTGFGLHAAVGPHWQAQMLFSWPLRSAGTVSAYQPFFNFGLTAQF